MKKNAKSMESPQTPHVEATEEQAKEYQRLKARNEWIKMNQKYLDQIQSKQLFYHRWIFWLVVIDLLFNLIYLIL